MSPSLAAINHPKIHPNSATERGERFASMGCWFFTATGSRNTVTTPPRLSLLARTLFLVLTWGSCASRLHTYYDARTRTRTTCTHKVLSVLFLRLFCPPCLALHQPALPQPTRSKDEGLVPAHLPMPPEASDGPTLPRGGGVPVA